MAARGRRGRGVGNDPPPPPPSIEQLLAVQTQLMQTLVQHIQNPPAGGAPHVPPWDAADPLEADDWLRAVEKQLEIAQCNDARRCYTCLANFREQHRTGGSHSSMDVPTMLLLSLGRSSERILGLITFPQVW